MQKYTNYLINLKIKDTLYFEFYSGCTIFAHNFVVKGTKTRFHLLQYLISI